MNAVADLVTVAREAGWEITVRRYNAPVEGGLRFSRGYVTIDLIAHGGGVHAQVKCCGRDAVTLDGRTFTDPEAIERLLQS